MTTSVTTLLPEHWPQIQAIYAEGLATGLAAFTANTSDWPDWHEGHMEIGRFVAKASNDKIVGWSALSPIPDT